MCMHRGMYMQQVPRADCDIILLSDVFTFSFQSSATDVAIFKMADAGNHSLFNAFTWTACLSQGMLTSTPVLLDYVQKHETHYLFRISFISCICIQCQFQVQTKKVSPVSVDTSAEEDKSVLGVASCSCGCVLCT